MKEANRNEIKSNFKKLLLLPVFFSVLFHAFFLVSKVSFQTTSRSTTKTKQKKVKLIFKSNKRKTKQIVNTQINKFKAKPKEAKFLGKQNQKVDRETKAAITGSFKSAGKGVKNGSKSRSQSISKSSQGNKMNSKKTVSRKKVSKKFDPKKIKLTDLGLGKSFSKKPAVKITPARGLKTGNQKQKGFAQNNDFIEDLPLGDMTKLNTVEYKYYGFYYRIRQKLEQYWGDSLRKQARKMWKRGRSIASNENKITALTITIDKVGNITDVKVKSTSGINELDDAAVESFNKAGPFPNPPSGLVKKGHAKIEWGFVVKS